MTGDLDILSSEEFRRSVEENLGRDPVQIALDRNVPHAALVASQVKYLRRAERKLPSYFAARCLLPPLAFEQSSSEETAARKNYSGRLCIDLTCGLGVDSFYLAKKFERVIAIERDPQLAAIARENFRRLGADNIEVVNAPAGEFLAEFGSRNADAGKTADLIYADPDRRNTGGKKMVRIEDCSPDIAALLPIIRRIAPRLVVKLSPLFDVAEIFRIFGPHTRAEVVSLAGECKEIIAEVAGNRGGNDDSEPISRPAVCAVAIGLGEVEFPFDEDWSAPGQPFEPEKYRWLVVPDVALQKARLARRYFSERNVNGNARNHGELYIDSDNGYAFASEKPENIMGKVLEICEIEPFDPKALKRRLKTQNIKNLDILKRNFPLSAAEIARQSGVREGGETGSTHKGGHTAIAFTKAAGKLWQIHLVNR